MSDTEIVRETLERGLPDRRYLEDKMEQGWRPVAIEWERTLEADESAGEPVPYGLKVGSDAHRLEVDDAEMEAMHLMLRQIVQDRPLSEVAAEMNRRGFRRRDGGTWTQGAVFELLPRLIEVAPTIYQSEKWQNERQSDLRDVSSA